MTVDSFKLSRIGKAPITIPTGVEAKIDGLKVTVKGPKGTLTKEFSKGVEISQKEGVLHVELKQLDRDGRAIQGLVRALLHNMVVGVSAGFERKLEVIGVGYRVDQRNSRELIFNLGYSHPIVFELPEGVTSEVSKDNKITLRSSDKEVLGRVAAKIRSFRAPEPYKGKGIKYAEETIIRKAGKTSGK